MSKKSLNHKVYILYADPLGAGKNVYTYDHLNQLISEDEHTYTYDSLYNRTAKDQDSYTLNTLSQITHDGHHEYTYDANGNLISDGESTFEYDILDRLIAVTKGKKRTEYTYDAFHRRISKDKEDYLWDGQQEIGMARKSSIKELRVLGEGLGAEIGAAVILELNGYTYFPIHDIQGSLVTLIYTNKKTYGTLRYTAFGEELTQARYCPWRFSSKRHDPETGFIYFGRRYYAPTLGRWVSPDPQGFEDGPNLYAYVHNCPLTNFDLYGLWSWKGMYAGTQQFMWGALEGAGYHLYNMTSSFGMKSFSNMEAWEPHSLLPHKELPKNYLGNAEYKFLPFTYEARRMGDDSVFNDRMRGRGRACGEQLVTLGGLFGLYNAAKNVLSSGLNWKNSLHSSLPQEYSREYLFSGKVKNPRNTNTGRNRNWLKPDEKAEGAHSVFRRDPMNNQVNHYATYRPQTNPYDPKPWELVVRFDNPAEPHYHFNKVFKTRIYTPHVHDPHYSGGVRAPFANEIPWRSY